MRDEYWRDLIERALWWETQWRAAELRYLRRLAVHVEMHNGQRLVLDDGPCGEELLRVQVRLAKRSDRCRFRADVAALRGRELRRRWNAEVATYG